MMPKERRDVEVGGSETTGEKTQEEDYAEQGEESEEEIQITNETEVEDQEMVEQQAQDALRVFNLSCDELDHGDKEDDDNDSDSDYGSKLFSDGDFYNKLN